MPTTEHLLHQLGAAAGLPEVRSIEPVRGHGFNHEILRATLADSRQVVLRWFAYSPFAGWHIDPGLDLDQRAQAIAWRNGLVDYLAGIGERLKEF